MARKKVTKNQLRKALHTITDSEKLRNKTMNLAEERLDSKHNILITDAEEVFLKSGGGYSLLTALLIELQTVTIKENENK